MRAFCNKKGQAVVELALIMPILLLILLGIMEFAIIFSNQLILENASRDATRYAVLGATDNEIRAYVATLTDTLNGTNIVTTITPGTGARPRGVPVTVKVTYHHVLMTPFIEDLLGHQLKLTASTTMRME